MSYLARCSMPDTLPRPRECSKPCAITSSTAPIGATSGQFSSSKMMRVEMLKFHDLSRGVVHSKNPRTPSKKIPKKLKKSKDFFGEYKIRTPYLGVNNSSNSLFKFFFFIKSSFTKKNPEKTKKFRKN